MKKTVIISLCAVIVVAAIIVSLVFVFGGKGEEPETEKLDMSGTWVVVALYNNDVPTFVENQFMAFTDSNASMYKDGNSEPFAASSYTVNEANQLILSDISREYKIDKKTDNCVRLYENSTTYMLLVRNSTDELSVSSFDTDVLEGKWDIIMKGDQYNNGEVLEFSDNSLNYYKSGAAEPFASAEFALSETGMITAESLGLTMNCFYVSDNTIVFVEQSGIVWELTK